MSSTVGREFDRANCLWHRYVRRSCTEHRYLEVEIMEISFVFSIGECIIVEFRVVLLHHSDAVNTELGL